jgi:pyruvate dehydrogenase E1 component alpha subunit
MSTLPDQLPDKEQCLRLYRNMLRIRRFEERCAELYKEQKIRGFLHLYIGEEAVATAVMEQLDHRDAVVATYREHGHALVRGLSMRSVMAEMFGKVDGCSRGRGGSMHLFSAEHGFFGGHAIVGGGLPVAAGLALARRRAGQGGIAACFFGEGAAAEGEFHEALNLAALWQLPMLFVCENNRYAMGTALERSESEPDIHAKAAAYRMRSEWVDGMDVVAVSEAARNAVAAVRDDAAPFFLECRTYRFRAHSMFDPELYRDRAEVEEWRRKGPLVTFQHRLAEAGLVSEAEIAALEQAVAEEVEDAVAFAERSTFEDVAELARDVYTPAGAVS